MHHIRFFAKLLARGLAVALSMTAWTVTPAPLANPTRLTGPAIQFDSTTNDFGQVLAGEAVQHVFTFTNTGSEDLIISKVEPGCGCTHAGEWTHLAKPGQTGIIPVRLNTAGFVGATDKAITVTCNDPRQPDVSLKLRGKVRKALEMQPPAAILNLQPDSPFGAAVIRITNHLEQPLLLFAPQSTNGALSAELRTNLPGRDYAVVISNTAPLPPGALAANITLATSWTNLPVLSLPVLANAFPTFTIIPSQIDLAVMATGQVTRVAVLNNGTNAVSLSEPTVSAVGAEVSLVETKPGIEFTATLSFLAGFRLPAGEKHWFSVRTSHPLCPVIQVPICRVSKAVPAAPLLARTPQRAVTAPLPLVLHTEALETLQLEPEQREETDDLRNQFLEMIGGPGQDPCDPAYLARWQKAQPIVDSLLTRVIGRSGVMQLDRALSSAE